MPDLRYDASGNPRHLYIPCASICGKADSPRWLEEQRCRPFASARPGDILCNDTTFCSLRTIGIDYALHKPNTEFVGNTVTTRRLRVCIRCKSLEVDAERTFYAALLFDTDYQIFSGSVLFNSGRVPVWPGGAPRESTLASHVQ